MHTFDSTRADAQEWVQAGVFLKLWQAGVEQFDELPGINWDWLSMDGAMTKAPLGGEKTGPNPMIVARAV
jgi:putative transposase